MKSRRINSKIVPVQPRQPFKDVDPAALKIEKRMVLGADMASGPDQTVVGVVAIEDQPLRSIVRQPELLERADVALTGLLGPDFMARIDRNLVSSFALPFETLLDASRQPRASMSYSDPIGDATTTRITSSPSRVPPLPRFSRTITFSRTDQLTQEAYPHEHVVGPLGERNSSLQLMREFDTFILMFARFRHLTTDLTTSISMLRLDNLIRLIYPNDHQMLSRIDPRVAMRWVASNIEFSDADLDPIVDSRHAEDGAFIGRINDRIADRMVNHVLGRIAAGYWGTF